MGVLTADMNPSRPAGPVLVYLVTEDWYFLSHRLPMAREAQRAGYQVHVATRVNKQGGEIEKHGFIVHPLDWRRGSFNPLNIVSIVRQVRALYRKLGPDLVHHVALEPVLVGSIASRGLPLTRLNALAGLGFGFASVSLKARLLRPFLVGLLRVLLNGPRTAVLVQNPDDAAAVKALGVAEDRVSIIPWIRREH